MGQTITAQTAGTVKSISVSAGSTTAPDSILVSIEVSDRGYSLSFPVTLEQSRRVHAGDHADLVDYWWGPELEATLTSIRPDPSNPQQSRLLVFDITGEEVNVGSQLTLSIGQRSTNYDVVVPSSAIRSDTNGSFVLAVVAKPSPLGNRYIATRVDVTVITSDETNSAVSGSLSNSDFVITTSTAPVEPGMQVRMAD
jgi:multidrug efflux pump subunit AcrA (membrane-fusion protein)